MLQMSKALLLKAHFCLDLVLSVEAVLLAITLEPLTVGFATALACLADPGTESAV